ncbi:MAG: BspA family leucine-rich repeat surface protein [Flavobacteriaceae bacterium]|uniref:BspA family leucine-rich repeat surface protein n=1 Tax=Flagellimonas sp. SN16 TaxID=3415142 RepID=UPI003C5F64DD|nr:BspA family leucine-rich repeat surface protein [Flavobacteriaceae bacterium]
MKIKNLFRTLLFAFLVISCGKEDDPKPPTGTNEAPTISAQAFTANENIGSGTSFGAVAASDPDGDALEFSITANDNGLFEIGKTDGKLTLASGKQLDYATKAQHSITVKVDDGTDNAQAKMTINVTKADPENQAPIFVEAEYSFSVNENITDADEIGSVMATDNEDNDLQYSIVQNVSGLFKIGATDGKLTLAAGKQLDFETTDTYMITVQVSDGELSADVAITISVQNINEMPVITNSMPITVTVSEAIADDAVITTLMATDPEGGTLEFSIAEDVDNLFEIGMANGELSLQTGKIMDYETAIEHTISVQVNDGELSTYTEVTISVKNVLEADPNDEVAFVTTWKTTSAMEEVQIGVYIYADYDFIVNWGDGTIEHYILNDQTFFSHVYENAGTYKVAIEGDFPHIRMGSVDDVFKGKLESIDQWGNLAWYSFEQAFFGCTNMVYNATDVPNLSEAVNMAEMFRNATKFNGDLNSWDVKNVWIMKGMFQGASLFNGNISSWNVSAVTNMWGMFYGASKFNGDISEWSVGNVTTMRNMFLLASDFDGNIGGWNVEKVVDFGNMFFGATSFNQDLSEWVFNTHESIDMSSMFSDATAFNQDLGNWNITKVTDMANMFNDSGMSAPMYGNTLVGWSQLANIPQDITLNALNVEYCDTPEVQGARTLLVSAGWTITGDAPVNCN